MTHRRRRAPQRARLHPAPAARRAPLSAAITFGWRGMLKVKHVPEQLLDVTITPVMFVLMFTYLFGGAIAGSTGEYLDYILPGILVMSVLFTTVYSGVSLNTDLTKGVVDRFRTLPIWRPAPLRRRAARRHRALPHRRHRDRRARRDPRLPARRRRARRGRRAGARRSCSRSGCRGCSRRSGCCCARPSAVMNAGFMGIFPLTFLSNVFVDPETLPSALEAFVNVNPISILADASRGLMEGDAEGSDIAISLAVAAALTLIFAPLTTRLVPRAAVSASASPSSTRSSCRRRPRRSPSAWPSRLPPRLGELQRQLRVAGLQQRLAAVASFLPLAVSVAETLQAAAHGTVTCLLLAGRLPRELLLGRVRRAVGRRAGAVDRLAVGDDVDRVDDRLVGRRRRSRSCRPRRRGR